MEKKYDTKITPYCIKSMDCHKKPFRIYNKLKTLIKQYVQPCGQAKAIYAGELRRFVKPHIQCHIHGKLCFYKQNNTAASRACRSPIYYLILRANSIQAMEPCAHQAITGPACRFINKSLKLYNRIIYNYEMAKFNSHKIL